MCGSRKGLQALVSPKGYEHHSLSKLADNSKRGCLMCLKIREALEDNDIEDEPGNPGWINFFALDVYRNRIHGSLPVSNVNGLPLEIKSMRYLESEGPKKDDYMIFMICSAEGSTGFHLDHPPISYSMSDDIVANAAIASLETCRRDHKRCVDHPPPLLPSRVIEVGSPDRELEPRLQTNSNSETDYYACLSYCWGGAQDYKTTRATIQDYFQSLKLSNLAQTIQDAIKVTRMLHLRYLWIDALCIIQDDLDDKKKEMAYMGEIYKNSTVTIAAARAKSVSQGFLDDWNADDKPSILPLMHLNRASTTNIKIVNTNCFDTTGWPLDSRAWALQEYLLSPRLLIFGDGGPVWQCQTHNLQPIIPSNKLFNMALQRLPDAIFSTPTRGPTRVPSPNSHDLPTSTRQKQHLVWKSIVENYSARQISVPTDRLPAITGVTNELSRIWNDGCDFGIWQSNLTQQLVWFAETAQRDKNAVPGVPSWSWLKVNKGVRLMDHVPLFDLPSQLPVSEYSRFEVISICHVEGDCLVVEDAEFLAVHEMTEEQRWHIFDRDLGNYATRLSWLDEWLDRTSRNELVGPFAVFLDFDREMDWPDQVAYLTLGVLVGINHDFGSYMSSSLGKVPGIADQHMRYSSCWIDLNARRRRAIRKDWALHSS